MGTILTGVVLYVAGRRMVDTPTLDVPLLLVVALGVASRVAAPFLTRRGLADRDLLGQSLVLVPAFAALAPSGVVVAVVAGTGAGWLARRLPGWSFGTPASRNTEVLLSLARAAIASGAAAVVAGSGALSDARPELVGLVAAIVHLVIDGALLVQVLAVVEHQPAATILRGTMVHALRVEATAITYGTVLAVAVTSARQPALILLVGVAVALAVALQLAWSDTARAQHAALLSLTATASGVTDPSALTHRVCLAVAELVRATEVEVRDYPAMPGEIDVALPLPDRAAWLVASGRLGLARDFTAGDRELLTSAGPVVATALRQAEQHAGMTTLAETDELTGLPNRRGLQSAAPARLAHDRRLGLSTAVLLLDLDGFKEINDDLGHDAGDRALVKVAGRLRRGARREDIVARLGGDEFVVVAAGLPSGTAAADVAERLRSTLVGVTVDGTREVGVSIGAAVSPDDGHALVKLLRVADDRMYEDKTGSRDSA